MLAACKLKKCNAAILRCTDPFEKNQRENAWESSALTLSSMKSVVLLPATSTPSGRASSCIAAKEPIRFVDPRGARLAERSRLLQRACSSDQASLSRPTAEPA